MKYSKTVIGLAGGIGSGKSFVAQLFQQSGCVVIDSDALAKATLDEPGVIALLRQWWGDGMSTDDGNANRTAIANQVFDRPADRARLEKLLHPRVELARDMLMKTAATDPAVKAFVWDSPLLFEAGLDAECDVIVYVDTPRPERLERVTATRGWDVAELDRREKSQWPLDKKQGMSDYTIENTGAGEQGRAAVSILHQVQEILNRAIAAGSTTDNSAVV